MTTTPFTFRQDRHQRVAWIVLILLLIFRIPYTLIAVYAQPFEDQSGSAIYEVGTYFLIAFLIWWERDYLADFHMDGTALALIIFLRPIQTLILSYWKVETPLAFPNLSALLILGISIGLVISLWKSGVKFTRFSLYTLGWLVIGIFTGICISIAENFGAFRSVFNPAHAAPSLQSLTSMSLNLFYHIGFAPINEEPLFRGFLWGYLRQLKWKDGWILLFQAALFTSAHVYFAQGYPLEFWVLIPGAALLFGLLTLRSRSISSSILAHGMINGSAYLLVSVLLNYTMSLNH